jgi:predicted dehydrogenase
MEHNTEPDLRVVQVGCGAMGKGWIENALQVPGIQLVGLVDIVRKGAEAAAEKFDLPPTIVFDTLAEALEKTNADVVFDVTVPGSHEAVVTEALRAGRHVLGEKPMSDTLTSAQRMVATAGQSGKTYAVTQNYRYKSPIRSLKSFLTSNAIGRVEEAHADFYMGAHFGGFRDVMDFPLILDMSIHTFDAARFLTGADPLSVYCQSFNPKRSWYKGDASAVVIFEMTDGIIFSYRGSWCAEGQNTQWDSNWRIIGNTGTVIWDGNEAFSARAIKPDGTHAFMREMQDTPVPIIPMEVTSHRALMQEFVGAVREGRKPETYCADNIKSLAMVLAAVESAKSGEKVAVKW